MRYASSRINEYEINRMLSLSKSLNAVQISKEMGRSIAAVRENLRANGVEPLRYCRKCEQNMPAGNFESEKRHVCRLHEDEQAERPVYVQDIGQQLADRFLEEVNPLQAYWTATPGDFRNQYVGIPSSS